MRETGLPEGPPQRLEWGLPERPTSCPCWPLFISDPTHHWMVGPSPAQSLSLSEKLLHLVSTMAPKITGQTLKTSSCSNVSNGDSWRSHNPSSRKWGRQLGGLGWGFLAVGLPQGVGVFCANSRQLLRPQSWAPQFWVFRPQINYFYLYTSVIRWAGSQGNMGRSVGVLAASHPHGNEGLLPYPLWSVQAPTLALCSSPCMPSSIQDLLKHRLSVLHTALGTEAELPAPEHKASGSGPHQAPPLSPWATPSIVLASFRPPDADPAVCSLCTRWAPVFSLPTSVPPVSWRNPCLGEKTQICNSPLKETPKGKPEEGRDLRGAVAQAVGAEGKDSGVS